MATLQTASRAVPHTPELPLAAILQTPPRGDRPLQRQQERPIVSSTAAVAAPVVQTLAAPPSVQSPEVSRATAAAPGPGSTGAAAGGAGGHGDLDELALKLYDRIRLRLQAELRLDRERAGMVSDLGF